MGRSCLPRCRRPPLALAPVLRSLIAAILENRVVWDVNTKGKAGPEAILPKRVIEGGAEGARQARAPVSPECPPSVARSLGVSRGLCGCFAVGATPAVAIGAAPVMSGPCYLRCVITAAAAEISRSVASRSAGVL
jgi:hypothetical protein